MIDIIRQNKKAYDYLAKAYADEWSDKPDRQLSDTFISFLPTSARILDVGCGPGHYSQYFYDYGFNVSGIDFSKEMIEIAKEKYKEIDFSQQDMQNLAFENNSFDALWVCSSFVHIPEKKSVEVLNEFNRVLKKPGFLFVNAIIGDMPYRIESEDEIGGNYKGNGRFFQWYPNSSYFIDLLCKAGFEVEHTIEKNITSYVLKNATIRTNKWVNYICKTSNAL